MDKNHFKSITDDRIEFCKNLFKDNDIVKCLLCPKPNFLNYKPTEEEIDNLIWTHIFPIRKVTGVQLSKDSYITMKFSYLKSNKANIWKIASVTFFIFCHVDILKTEYNFLRHDYLLQKVDSLISDSKFTTWFGKLEFSGHDENFIDSSGDYYGHIITYKGVELK